MNIKLFNVALGIVLTATTISASAQKNYTEGVVTLSTSMNGQPAQPKYYFRADSSALTFSAGPANIRIIQNAADTYFAVLIDVPVASKKMAAVATPAEVEDVVAQLPKFTFAPTSETKQISGFNCKKVIATDTKTNKPYDIWVTNDVTVPQTAFAVYYAGIGGFPVQYTAFSMGQETTTTVLSITADKAPAGTFGITADYDRISMDDLKAMSGRH